MAGGKESKKGKKGRKHGRNKRRPSGTRQPDRTAANKLRRIRREARKGLATYESSPLTGRGLGINAPKRAKGPFSPGYLVASKSGGIIVIPQ